MRPPVLVTLSACAALCGGGLFLRDGASLSAWQGPGVTGSLRGHVELRRGTEVSERRPGVAELSAPRAESLLDVRPVVVFLEAPEVPEDSELRSGRPALRPGRAQMDQRNETFAPHVLSVNLGSTVDFPNNDRTFHNVFSLSKVKRFDLGRYGRGESERVKFDKAGVVRVFCDIHSHMSAFVLVFNHPFHTNVDEEGRYEIDNIPPGTYTVIAWQEGEARDTKTVTIPATGGATDLDLLVR